MLMNRTKTAACMMVLIGMAAATASAQFEDFRDCEHLEPVGKPPLRMFPTPGLWPEARLSNDGLVVNDTNASHTIVIDTFRTISTIQVVIWEKVSGGAREVLRKRFATSDIIARGGVCRIYCHGGDDVVRHYLWLPATVYGGAGSDALHGGNCSDQLYGGKGNDQLFGGPGCDQLSGGGGNDWLSGDDEMDVLDGGDGDDVLDALEAPAYQDLVVGGLGKDLFMTNGDWEVDFDPNEDSRL